MLTDITLDLEMGEFDRYIVLTISVGFCDDSIEEVEIAWEYGARELDWDSRRQTPVTLTLEEIHHLENQLEVYLQHSADDLAVELIEKLEADIESRLADQYLDKKREGNW